MKRQIMYLFLTGAMLLSVGWLAAQIQYFRPYDQHGVNMFETLKTESVEFEKLKVRIGGHFAQQFQALNAENTPVDLDNDGVIDNPIHPLSSGFNLATANLNIDVQFEEGVRLHLITYLSSRNHPEAWVKGGFIQFDRMPFLKSEFIDNIMDYVTVKVGHMEVNFGDGHFRRTDNGNAMYNPFVGNYILDAFNTEIGAEFYVKNNGWLGVLGVTGGEINGNVTKLNTTETDDNASRSPSIIGKLAYDRQLTETVRLRLSGSAYYTASSATNNLYSGDRAGSRYYQVLTPPGVGAGASGVFASGRYNPGFRDEVLATQFNAFLKLSGLELFGTFDYANGRHHGERSDAKRNVNQFAIDALYRFGSTENFYLGGRYNIMNAEDPAGVDISIQRIQAGMGWFVTPNLLAKVEYVTQEYRDFPQSSLLHGGKFNGVMVEAVVGF